VRVKDGGLRFCFNAHPKGGAKEGRSKNVGTTGSRPHPGGQVAREC